LNKKILLSNIFHAFLTKGINFLVPLLLMPFILRIFGVEKFGEYFYAQSVLQTYALFIDFGFVVTAVKAISNSEEDNNERNKTASFVIVFKLILTLISVIFFFGYFFLEGFNANNFYLFLFVFSSFCFQINLPIWFFQGIQKNSIFSLVNLISKIILLCFVFFTITKNSPLFLIPLYEAIAYLVALILSFLIMIYFQKFSFIKFKIKQFKALLFESFQIFFISILNWAIVSGSIIILKKRVSDIEFGIFSAYSRLAYYVFAIVQPLNQALLPFFAKLFSKKSKEAAFELFQKSLLALVAFILFILISSSIGIKYINAYLFGNSNLEQLTEFRLVFYTLIVWVGFVLINSFISTQFLVTQNKSVIYKRLYLVNAIIAVICSYILSISYGSLGIAFALIAGELIMLLFLINQMLQFKKYAAT